MGGRSSRSASAVLIALTLLLSSLGMSGVALAQGCEDTDTWPPEPPYGGPAVVVEFEWAENVQVEYYAMTQPSADNIKWMTKGDIGNHWGGCGEVGNRLLITKRVQTAQEQEAGLGTFDPGCGVAGWAEMREDDLAEDFAEGDPLVYTIVAESNKPCEGAYVDIYDEGGTITDRDQPESSNVAAKVTYYRAGDEVPYGDPVTLSADVGVHNSVRWNLYGVDYGGDYETPLPVAIGTIALPPIGSGSDEAAAAGMDLPFDPRIVGLVAGAPPGPPADTTGADEPRSKVRLLDLPRYSSKRIKAGGFFLGALTVVMIAAMEDHDKHGVPMPSGPELIARAIQYFLWLTASGDDDPSAEPAPDKGAAPPPKKDPPEMKTKHEERGRKWVSLPAEAAIYQVHSDMEKRTLKTGVWYQMKENEDGTRDFYNKKGSLVGTSNPDDDDVVVVREWDKKPAADAESTAEAASALTDFFEAVTDSDSLFKAEPDQPPPSAGLAPGRRWGSLRVDTATEYYAGGSDEDPSDPATWDEERVLWAGKTWYQVERHGDGLMIYDEKGDRRGYVDPRGTWVVRLHQDDN